MFFNLCIILGVSLLVLTWNKQYKYKVDSLNYQFWYNIFEVGAWLLFIGLLQYVL